ncbi:MAG: hypothetical protein IT513_16845 [Burkholderiales bacterium]|nr:hypothetical protein [Burkholderiales bacterium]
MTELAVLARPGGRYPAESVELRMLPGGRPLLVRPTTAKDAELLQNCQGIGRLLFERLLRYADDASVRRIQGDVLHGNTAMLGLARHFDFALRRHPDGAWLARVERTLGALPRPGRGQAGTASRQSSLPPA